MEGGNILAWVPRGRITVRGRHSLNDQGMVAVCVPGTSSHVVL